MKAKSFIATALSFCLLLGCTACSVQPQQEPSSPPASSSSEDNSETVQEQTPTYVIGFNNYNMATDFPQQLYDGIEAAAENAEADIEIMYAEAAGDPQKMVSNIDTFITAGVDLIIDFNFNPEVGTTLSQKCSEAGIPLISVDCFYENAYFFGVNNLLAGKTAGEYLAQLVKDQWDSSMDYLVLEFNNSAGAEVRQRLEGIVEGLAENGIELTDEQIVWIDYNNDTTKAQSTAADFLTAHPDSSKIAFGVLTDPAAAGVLAAVETAKRSEDCMIVSHGGEAVAIEMLEKDNCYQGTVCYDPAQYGELLIPLAVKLMNGEEVETMNYSQQYMLTRDNLDS